MTVDVFAAIAGRRSYKRFAPRPVEMDKILQCVQAGVLAPSSGNIQNWKFIIVTDIDRIRSMYHITLQQEPFLTATAAVIVVGDVDHAHMMYGMRGKRLYTIQNCAAAVENFLLASYALNLASIWVGAFDEDKLCDMFGIPGHQQRPQAILLLGYPDGEPEPKDERPLTDFVFFNSFGNKVMHPHILFYDWSLEWRLQAQKLKSHLKQVAHSAGMKTTPKPPAGEKTPGSSFDDGSEAGEPNSAQQEPHGQHERPPNPATVKKRIRDIIDSLKKEEHRRHDGRHRR